MERRNATRRQTRFNAQSSTTVECSGCRKPILAGRTFTVIVRWYEVFVLTATGEEYLDPHGNIRTSVRLFTDPMPRAVLAIEPPFLEVKLKTEPTLTVHHLNGCGVVTKPWRHRVPGNAYGGKRQ